MPNPYDKDALKFKVSKQLKNEQADKTASSVKWWWIVDN